MSNNSNSINSNNCIWWNNWSSGISISGMSQVTTVGLNGISTYYGTYDQGGNISELSIDESGVFNIVGGDWTSNNDYISLTGNNISQPLIMDSYGTYEDYKTIGLRLAANYFNDIRYNYNIPNIYSGNNIQYSIDIINNDNYIVSGINFSIRSINLNSSGWTGIFSSGSSIPVSGNSHPSGSISLIPGEKVTISVSGSAINNSGEIILYSNIYGNNLVSSQEKIKIYSSLQSSPNTYQKLFESLNWNNIESNKFVFIGDKNNPPNSLGNGSVPYNYYITQYEITNNEYCKYLNSIDPQGINPNNVYTTGMSYFYSGIVLQSGNSNGSKYVILNNIARNKPVVHINWFRAARYCNWLHNGAKQETVSRSNISGIQNYGAYSVGSSISGLSVIRSSGARFFIPNRDEWIKAGFYNPNNQTYSLFPIQSDSAPSGAYGIDNSGNIVTNIDNSIFYPDASIYSINCSISNNPNDPASTGVSTVGKNGASSFYGIYDMAGNVGEIIDNSIPSISGKLFGGTYIDFINTYNTITNSYSFNTGAAIDINSSGINILNNSNSPYNGFRIAAVPSDDSLSLSYTKSSNGYQDNTQVDYFIEINNLSDFTIDNAAINIVSSGASGIKTWNISESFESYNGLLSGTGNIDTNISLPPNSKLNITYSITPYSNNNLPIFISGLIYASGILESNLTNNSISDVLYKSVDLEIMSSGSEVYQQNQQLNRIFTVKNNSALSDSPNTLVKISHNSLDIPISGMAWTASYGSNSSGPLSGIGPINHNINIAKNESVIYNIDLQISGSGYLPIVMSGIVQSPNMIVDTNQSNNQTYITGVLVTDLSISATGNPSYSHSSPPSFVITATNNSNNNLTNCQILSNIDTNIAKNISWSGIYSSGSSGPLTGTGNINSLVTLSSSGFCSFSINTSNIKNNHMGEIPCGYQINVPSGVIDPNITNNSGIYSSVMTPSDLETAISSAPSVYSKGSSILYSLVYKNNGPSNIDNINIKHNIPSGINNASWLVSYFGGSGATFGSTNDINENIFLNSSGIARLTVNGIVDLLTDSPLIINSTILSPTGCLDPDLSNNQILYTIDPPIKIGFVGHSKFSCSNNGYVDVAISGGIPPYTIILNENIVNTSIAHHKFNNLSGGTYYLSVFDSFGNSDRYNQDIVITDSNINAIINSIYAPKLLDSYGYLDISISGFGPFAFIFQNVSDNSTISIPLFETKYILSSTNNVYNYIIDDLLTPGEYNLTIKNSENCYTITQITIPNIDPISVNISTVSDRPVSIRSPSQAIDIYDTLLIPYKNISENTDLWNLIKDYSLKDSIYFLINEEKYEFNIVRTMLDKYCLQDNKIQILKLGNNQDNWYFYLYIAPSINLAANPELMGAKIKIINYNRTQEFDVVFGLSEDGNIEQNNASLIRGSIILNGTGYDNFINGQNANISIGLSNTGSPSDDFEIKNISKTSLRTTYNSSVVTSINFLENMNVLNEYISINQSSCNTTLEDMLYIQNIKKLLVELNSFNNLNNIYIFNNSTIHNGQINCLPLINEVLLTSEGQLENNYTIDYFTFDKLSSSVQGFYVNNQLLKNTTAISGLDSRYIIIRIKDLYNNIPKIINFNTLSIVESYDNHFVNAKKIIQNYNQSILNFFNYGDILVFIPDASVTTETTTSNTNTPTTPITPQTPTTNLIPTIQQSKDQTNTSSLNITVFPTNTKCILRGPKNYYYEFTGSTNFTNLLPGVYLIEGNEQDLEIKNLYQNKHRILVNKNSINQVSVEFTSYLNRIFIR